MGSKPDLPKRDRRKCLAVALWMDGREKITKGEVSGEVWVKACQVAAGVQKEDDAMQATGCSNTVLIFISDLRCCDHRILWN